MPRTFTTLTCGRFRCASRAHKAAWRQLRTCEQLFCACPAIGLSWPDISWARAYPWLSCNKTHVDSRQRQTATVVKGTDRTSQNLHSGQRAVLLYTRLYPACANPARAQPLTSIVSRSIVASFKVSETGGLANCSRLRARKCYTDRLARRPP